MSADIYFGEGDAWVGFSSTSRCSFSFSFSKYLLTFGSTCGVT